MIPANGLTKVFDLPGAPLPDETPIGFQAWQEDPGAAGGIAFSRALAIYLSQE